MRRNKTVFGALLLVAVLMLGIGYAAIAGINLNIDGTLSATPSNDNFKVKFDGTPSEKVDARKLSANSTNVLVTPSITDEHNAKLEVSGLTTTGDTVAATYTIKNESPELGATITESDIQNDNTEYFEVTRSIDKTTLAAGESTTVTVTVKLKKTPVDAVTATITIPFVAEPTQN